MNTALFSENMSYVEALNVFFLSIEQNRSQEEIKKIKADFATVVPVIVQRALSGDNTTLTSYTI